MLTILLFSTLAQAEEKDRIHGFRIGACAGFSADCIAANLKVEYAGRFVGANLSMPLAPAWAATSIRFYPVPVIEKTNVHWRPYAYVGGSVILFAGVFPGGGAGADIHLTQSKRLCLQPSVGIVYTFTDYLPAGSLSVMYTY